MPGKSGTLCADVNAGQAPRSALRHTIIFTGKQVTNMVIPVDFDRPPPPVLLPLKSSKTLVKWSIFEAARTYFEPYFACQD
jgi:hypothetical protein